MFEIKQEPDGFYVVDKKSGKPMNEKPFASEAEAQKFIGELEQLTGLPQPQTEMKPNLPAPPQAAGLPMPGAGMLEQKKATMPGLPML